MRIARTLTALALTLGLGVAACATEEPASQSAAHTDMGALGFAPELPFGQAVTGQIAAPQIDVWKIALRAGDQVQLTKTITGGDLKPDMVLFQGTASAHVSSTSYDVTPTSLTKDYALDHNGTYYVVVRGYEGVGSGSYSLTATCLGGPCAGEVPPPPVLELDEAEAAECITKARVCAVDRLPQYGGAVGAVRAQQIFDQCLAEATVETYSHDVPATCAPACTQSEDAQYLCDGVVGTLPWLADQTEACVGEFNSCVDECWDANWGDPDDYLAYGGESICVVGEAAFNGSCRDVADLEVCGGRWAGDSCEACYINCHATTGAWIDDLDTICDETCNCDPSEDLWY
jgi:hypothetical protein